MKRFALFAWAQHYPAGGFRDFRSSHDTREEAEEAGRTLLADPEHRWDLDEFEVTDLRPELGS